MKAVNLGPAKLITYHNGGYYTIILLEKMKNGEWVRVFQKPDRTYVGQLSMNAPYDWIFQFSVKKS